MKNEDKYVIHDELYIIGANASTNEKNYAAVKKVLKKWNEWKKWDKKT
jgi:hypothetical protein